VYIPSGELYAGNWEGALKEMERISRRIPHLRLDGAAVCAREITSMAGGS
jgi:hypothetical protein